MTLTRMINRHGVVATLTHTATEGAYVPGQGTISGRDTDAYTIKCYFFNYDIDEIDGTSVLKGDRKALFNPFDTSGAAIPEPQVDDTIAGHGDTVSIISVRKILSGDTVRCYVCQVRE